MTQKPRRRWFQFSLRSLLIAMLVLFVGLGLYLPARRKTQEQWEAVNYLRTIAVSMTDGNGNEWMLKKKPEEMSPTWQRWLGVDCPTCTSVAILSSQRDEVAIRNHVMKLRQLESINLSVYRLDDKFLEALSRFPKLQKLEVTSGFITDDGILHFAGKQSLRSLYFRGSHLSDRGLATVAALPHLKSLEWYADEGTTDDGVFHLRGNLRLTKLALLGNGLSDVGLEHLSTCENLEDLSVETSTDKGDGLTEKGIRYLVRLKKLKKLQLRSSFLPEIMAAISGLTNLEDLRLYGPVLHDEDIAALAPLTSLRFITIEDAKLTGVGLRGLSNLKQLKQLNISLAGLGDEDMELLSTFSQLESLDLEFSAVTDRGLMKLVGLKRLSRVAISGSKLTVEGVRKFQQQVAPGVYIFGVPRGIE